jgi:hypothetical protein
VTYDKNQTVTEALRRIGLVADDDPAPAETYERAAMIADGVFAEIKTVDGLTDITWTLETVPVAAFNPLVEAVAYECAPSFGRTYLSGRSGRRRLCAVLLSDDRTDRRDLDNDGTVSDSEAVIGDESVYY